MHAPHHGRFCAVIVAGGTSSRLGHTPKAGLSDGSRTLLERTLLAVAAADACVVVGPNTLPLPAGVLRTREDPPYSGPAAALHAGLEKLADHYALCGAQAPPWCLLVGVDTPNLAPAVRVLTARALAEQEFSAQAQDFSDNTSYGFWGVSEGVFQPLMGIYRFEPLRQVFASGTTNASVRSFLKRLNPAAVELDPAHTADIDTWDQARSLGFDRPQWSTY